MDESIERWKQKGRLAVWMNPRTKDESWNLTADSLGATSLLELIALMESAESPSRRTLKVTQPNFTPDHGGRWKIRVGESLRLVHDRDEFEPDRFILTEPESKKLQLELGTNWLPALRDAIVDIERGGGDYRIGNDKKGSDRLWVWWTSNEYWDSPKPREN
jgi:hypothetical protein